MTKYLIAAYCNEQKTSQQYINMGTVSEQNRRNLDEEGLKYADDNRTRRGTLALLTIPGCHY